MLKVVGASWFQTRVSSVILGSVAALGVVTFIVSELNWKEEDGNYAATAYWSESSGFRIDYWGQGNNLKEVPTGIARAYYNTQRMFSSGWAVLEIETQPEFPDEMQAFAAGLLEGSLSWQMMYWHWINTVRDACITREEFCKRVRQVLEANTNWVREKAAERSGRDPYWHQVKLFYAQLDGLESGWRLGVERSRQSADIPHGDFLWMNALGDLVDLERRLGGTYEDTGSLQAASIATNLSSAFVKFLPDTGELFVAHNTGGLYRSMLRLQKRYEFCYHQMGSARAGLAPGGVVAFSSYPGAISSQDDFYLVSSDGLDNHQLVVVGVPITNYNTNLWDAVDPTQQVLLGPRVMMANRLAADGRTWGKLISHRNSGTGNRQWLITDYGKLNFQQKTSITSREVVQEVDSKPSNLWSVLIGKTSKKWEERNVEEGTPSSIQVEEESIFGKQINFIKSSEVQDPTRKQGNGVNGVKSLPVRKKKKLAQYGLQGHPRDKMRHHPHHRGLLWIVEQLPGLTHTSDQSHILHEKGYWASTGLPFHLDISDATGNTEMQKLHGTEFSFHKSSRALVFLQQQVNATDLTLIHQLMRGMNCSTNLSSICSPVSGIAVRGDVFGKPMGVIDTKIFVAAPGKPVQFHSTAGPSFISSSKDDNAASCVSIRPFQWYNSAFNNESHIGQPDFWKFTMFKSQWEWDEYLNVSPD